MSLMVIIKFQMGEYLKRDHSESKPSAKFRVVVKDDGDNIVAIAERLTPDATGSSTWVPVVLDETEYVVRLGLLRACKGGRGPVTVDADQCFVSEPIHEIDLGKIK
jgi:hypothetical protein